MKNLKYLLLVGIAVFAMLAVACGGGDDDAGSATPTPTTTDSSPTATSVYNPTPTGSIDAVNVCGGNPDPATPAQVQVTSPGPGDMVTSPLQITGLIAVFEAQFNIAIKDAGGNDIVTSPGMSSEGQTLAPFSVSVPFTVTAETPPASGSMTSARPTAPRRWSTRCPSTLSPSRAVNSPR